MLLNFMNKRNPNTSEALPQNDEAFGRDGHSPPGDIRRVIRRRGDLKILSYVDSQLVLQRWAVP